MTYLMGTIPEDYVLRIYRRGRNDPRIRVGVVEEVGAEGNKAFTNIDELWSILNSSKAETAKAGKENKSLRHRKQGGFSK